ncbi:hypothetical protein CJF31_00010110 [Rutstroemia sp. NJR-2017a BVV2]|nr:hypothetical protein CJF31_00009871 [Rutstroemia sp. NJR-2017a BVV2]PQE19683.1 hypothetical protein CJF31_00010110 [Rutstroemia sp. NJR-2017a BVV2]
MSEGDSDSDDDSGSGDADAPEIDDPNDPNPGDEIIWFGRHINKKFDELPSSYVDWVIREIGKNPDNPSQNFARFMNIYDQKQAWLDRRQSKIPPGKTEMWFGMHEGTLFEDLPYDYMEYILNIYDEDPVSCHTNIRKFKELSDKYNSWLEEKHGRKKSPGSITIWFGQDKGREFRTIYRSQPRKWRWLIKEHRLWRPRLLAIAAQYEEYLASHRRKQPSYRSRPIIVNPVGERLGRMDDEPASDGGDYESDDGFVVADSEDLNNDHDNEDEDEDFVPEADTGGEEAAPTTPSPDRSLERASPQFQRPVSNSSDSDDASLPELDAILQNTPKPSSALRSGSARRPRKLIISSDTEDDSRELVTPTRRSTANPSRPSRKVTPIAGGNDKAARVDDSTFESLTLQSPLGAVNVSGVGTHAAPVVAESASDSDSDAPLVTVRMRRATFPQQSQDVRPRTPPADMHPSSISKKETPAKRKQSRDPSSSSESDIILVSSQPRVSPVKRVKTAP